ncbi:MAG: enoyl-CoA hydratase-related protein [Thermoplasmata archaeon]|nr:enoyl-CoA hydratase-related protein [Thermoplasmata archaeon]
MTYKTILVENDGGKTIIKLNTPDNMNALDKTMSDELDDALLQAQEDETVKVVIITGEGKAFCAGGNVKAMADAPDAEAYLEQLSGWIHKPVHRIYTMEKVVIAAVNGHAIGAGCGIAMACDLRYGSKKAKFNMGFMKIGLAPGCGTYFLPKLVGKAKAAELIYLSETIDADTAEKLGLVNHVLEPEKLMEEVMNIAEIIRKGPTLAIGRAKTLLRLSDSSRLEEHLAAERHMISISGATADFREGVTAFTEKREPKFVGK